jgi:hypothetical protein
MNDKADVDKLISTKKLAYNNTIGVLYMNILSILKANMKFLRLLVRIRCCIGYNVLLEA